LDDVVVEELLGASANLAPGKGIILAKSMAFELMVAKYPPQIRVAAEPNSEEVEHLALVPIRGFVEGGDRGDLFPLLHVHLDRQALPPGYRAEQVSHLETLFALRVIIAHDVQEQLAGLLAMEMGEQLNEVARRNPHRFVAVVAIVPVDCFAQFVLKSFDQGATHVHIPSWGERLPRLLAVSGSATAAPPAR
jgi:hypothetical protein